MKRFASPRAVLLTAAFVVVVCLLALGFVRAPLECVSRHEMVTGERTFAGQIDANLRRLKGNCSPTKGLPTDQPPDSTASSCTVYESGRGAKVTITSSAGDKACSQWIQQSSSATTLWTRDASQAQTLEPSSTTVCDVHKDDVAINVADVGGLIEGTSICGQLAQQGWSE